MPNRPAFFKLFMGEDICNFPYIRLYILAPRYRDFVSVPTAVRSCCWCSFPSHYHVSSLGHASRSQNSKYSRGKIIPYKYTDRSSGEWDWIGVSMILSYAVRVATLMQRIHSSKGLCLFIYWLRLAATRKTFVSSYSSAGSKYSVNCCKSYETVSESWQCKWNEESSSLFVTPPEYLTSDLTPLNGTGS